MSSFQPFSLLHALLITAIAAMAVTATLIGRRMTQSSKLRMAEYAAGICILLVWIVDKGWGMLPERFDPSHSLPIQFCDLTGLTAAVVLVTRWRPMRVILYFLGFGLSTQAISTPDLSEGPDRLAFWLFWLFHGSLVIVAVYDLAARGFRPCWRDYGLAVGVCAVYVAIVLPIDIAFQSNYGFVGPTKPTQPSIVDPLGPWPQRIISIALLACAGMALMMLPWEVVKWSKPHRSALRL